MVKTHTHRLREFAKFASGLVFADFFTGLWLTTSSLLPLTIHGIGVTQEIAYLGMAFDVLLFIILVHYAWHPSILEPSTSRKKFFLTLGILMAIIGLFHVARLAFGLDFSLGSFMIPMWISWIGALITLYISYASFHFLGISK